MKEVLKLSFATALGYMVLLKGLWYKIPFIRAIEVILPWGPTSNQFLSFSQKSNYVMLLIQRAEQPLITQGNG